MAMGKESRNIDEEKKGGEGREKKRKKMKGKEKRKNIK